MKKRSWLLFYEYKILSKIFAVKAIMNRRNVEMNRKEKTTFPQPSKVPL